MGNGPSGQAGGRWWQWNVRRHADLGALATRWACRRRRRDKLTTRRGAALVVPCATALTSQDALEGRSVTSGRGDPDRVSRAL